MVLALTVLGVLSLAELLLWLPPLWDRRKIIARILLFWVAVATFTLLVERLAAWTVLVAAFSIYRCINLARIAADRVHTDYLYHASLRTTLWLTGLQSAVTAVAALGYRFTIEPIIWWDILASIQLVSAVILLASTLRHLDTTKKPGSESVISNADLPSLTVAIPARNETTDLERCLQSLTASAYPKLEIIVLDDCSQNQRTPEIIRGFAHDGVRFVAGKIPPDKWLAKNYAYAQLAKEANGELLLFCGVDTRFEPESLSVLVKTLLRKQKLMISVVPRNTPPRSFNPLSWLIQPSRYAWELALPRRLLQRPPVLSTCWLIERKALKAAGGFDAVQRKGVPESYFAKRTAADGDGYSFLQSDADIGITASKSFEAQKATAIRTRYLQLHRRPELVALIGLAELALLVWPLVLCITSLLSGEWLLGAVSGLSFLMATIVYGKLVNLTYRRFTLKSVWLLPLAVLYDIGLLNYSMWQYEFREVLWKGRNVCIPVMQVVPKLPKIT
ncbi:MAG TPA: glycosyltransferase family 2 protein [Candidatus Saccharimonadales bacterium]|nr:glycosyltransferase family 2 protein [Candidatus Saccharimonadales bacterium]